MAELKNLNNEFHIKFSREELYTMIAALGVAERHENQWAAREEASNFKSMATQHDEQATKYRQLCKQLQSFL